MLTFLPQSGSECVTPEAYWLTIENEMAELQQIPWPKYDTLTVRGAGRFLNANGSMIRPVQVSRVNSYGDAVAFFSAQPQVDVYQEERISALLPEHVSGCKYRVDGLHTYALSNDFEVIDVRCQLPDPTKILRKLTGK